MTDMVIMGMITMRMAVVGMAIVWAVVGRLAKVDAGELRVQRRCRLVVWVWTILAVVP